MARIIIASDFGAPLEVEQSAYDAGFFPGYIFVGPVPGGSPIQYDPYMDAAAAAAAKYGVQLPAALRAALGLPVAATVTSAGALVVQKHNPADATSGALTMTLPTGAAAGSLLAVEKIDSATNAVTVTGNMRGSAGQSIPLTAAHEVRVFVADAAGSWWPIADHRTTASLDTAYGPTAVATAITKVTDPYLDVRARGATGTNATADTAAIQQAFTDVRNAGGGTVLIPKTYTTNAPLILAGSGVHVIGVSRENCGIQNSTTDVIQLGDSTTSLAQSSIERLKLRSLTGGGHVFIQGRNTSQTDFLQLDMYQDNDAKSIFESAGLNLLETLWRSCFTQHRQTATVPGFNLVASNGGLNRNTWEQMRVLYSGNYVWHVEETSANYCRDNIWRDINAEVCNGGIWQLLSPYGGSIEKIGIYDLTTTTKDLITLGKSTGNTGVITLRDIARAGGTLGASLVDVRLNNTGVSNVTIERAYKLTIDMASTRSMVRDLENCTLSNTSGTIEYYNRGPVFRSPDGTRYIITVANGGAVSTTVAP